jgi:hypothetical protein
MNAIGDCNETLSSVPNLSWANAGLDSPAGFFTSSRREPAELIGNSHCSEIAALPYRSPSVIGEFERLRAREWQSHGRAQPGILLQIIAPDSVHVSASTGVVRAIQRHPQPGTEGITQVRLRRAERRLLADLPLKEFGVLHKEPASQVHLQHPGMQRA